MFKFNTTKEYIITYKDFNYRVICTKIVKDKFGNVQSIHFKQVWKEDTLVVDNLSLITDVILPIENTEFFTMYMNWLNFYRKGIHQDLDYAEELFNKIDNTIKQRTIVMEGAGAFIYYDKSLYIKLYEAYK